MIQLEALEETTHREELLTMARDNGFHAGKIAETCGVTLRQLERYFSESLHCTPSQWLRRQRMVQARRDLLDGKLVKEVANELGFKHVSHFSHEFKRYHGVPPSHYRQIAGVRARFHLKRTPDLFSRKPLDRSGL